MSKRIFYLMVLIMSGLSVFGMSMDTLLSKLHKRMTQDQRVLFDKKVKILEDLKKSGEAIDYSEYIKKAIEEKDINFTIYILWQLDPLLLLKVMAYDKRLPVTLLPYSLYRLNLDVKDLAFLGVADDKKMDAAKTATTKDLVVIYSLAKERDHKAFGKAMLDYYILLKKYGGPNKIPQEILVEMFSFLDPDDISALLSKK